MSYIATIIGALVVLALLIYGGYRLAKVPQGFHFSGAATSRILILVGIGLIGGVALVVIGAMLF